MYALLLAAAIALAGQVALGSGSRYAQPAPAARNAAGNPVQGQQGQLSPRQTWLNDLPAQGAPTSRPVLPAPPGQLSNDYRARGQQPSASAARPSHVAATVDSSAKVKPAQLIRSLLKPPTIGQLAGSPLSLAEAVEGASSRSEQTLRVEAYWDLSEATANYYMALREVVALQTMQQGVDQPSADWERARRSLVQRGQAARRSVQTAQVRLQRMIGRNGGTLPLASDLPHCGAYDTRYDEIFSGRLPSSEAQQLDELLPLARQEIRNQAANVVAAHGWRETVSQRRDPQTDGSGLLKAHELLSLSRRMFVQSLCRYNANIARYAEIASPGQVGTGRLVAMLIYTEGGQDAGWGSRDIRRTSGEETLNSKDTSPSQTFAEGQRNRSRRVETPGKEAEHSILTGRE